MASEAGNRNTPEPTMLPITMDVVVMRPRLRWFFIDAVSVQLRPRNIVSETPAVSDNGHHFMVSWGADSPRCSRQDPIQPATKRLHHDVQGFAKTFTNG